MALDSQPSIGEKVEESCSHAASMGESHAMLAVERMTCASCAMRIEKGLKKVPGVKDASMNLATEQASVTYDPAQTNVEQMVQKVEMVGYKATPQIVTRRETTLVSNTGSVSMMTPAGSL